jgi:prephenate dehydratase
LIEDDDTAEAARRLSEGKLPKTSGVIANKACADLYGLEILQESIHDLKHNLTLFISIKKMGKS